jgi:16S rRNA G966 N2-methylase RsmD
MPFAYYGAKHGLASRYPAPRHRVIVEPFAGSAAYSVHHANRIDHAIIIDADAQLVELWHELQAMTEADVDLIGNQLDGERFTSPLLAGIAGSTALVGTLAGRDRAVTPRMRTQWPSVRRRIVRALPYIKTWQIIHGTYADAPDIDATWFIDPPYQSIISTAGNDYRHGQSCIDFDHLAAWCRSRPGQTIVCEQSPASWLPFHPFASQGNGTQVNGSTRQEVVWLSDVEYLQLFATDPNPQDHATPDTD